jgi:DNA-binding LacI/PurR family transcriptional regulator
LQSITPTWQEGRLPVTIAEVAATANVSTATVSRVLSGSTNVTAATRAHVQEVVHRLGYRPSAVARSLRRRSTTVYGLIVTDISNPFFSEMVRGAEDAALARGRSVLLCNGDADPEREHLYLRVLVEHRVDALVVASDPLILRHRATLENFPAAVVLVNSDLDVALPCITSDNRLGGRLAAQHVAGLGYSRFAAMRGPGDAGRVPSRLAGIHEVVPPDVLALEPSTGDISGGEVAMARLAERIRPPFAVLCHNDLEAIGALAHCRRLGWRVPDDVAIMGFDDIPLSAYVDPPLSTIAQDMYALGVAAIDLVARLETGWSGGDVEYRPVNLVVRRSTAAAGS